MSETTLFEQPSQAKSQEATAFELLPSDAISQITRAEIDVQISTAKRYPRAIGMVKRDMLSFATLDQETAEACFYSLPRGGKNIQGPSVRLAEIAVSCYGNLRAGARIIEVVASGDAPHVVIQAVAHDLEKNVAVSIEKRRRIFTKRGKSAPDEDDINLAANAGSAIAFRDAVFKVVPLALIKPVFEQAKQVAIGDAKTLVDRRARAFASFAKMGVPEDRVLALLGRATLDDVTLSDLETLFGLHTAIKDGQTTIDESFPAAASKPVIPGPKSESTPEVTTKVSDGPPRRGRQRQQEQEQQDFVADTPQKLLLRKLADAGVSEADYVRFLKAAGVRVEMIAGLSNDDAEKCLAGFDNDIAVVKEGF